MQRSSITLFAACFLFAVLLIVSIVTEDQYFLFISLFFIIGAVALFFFRFERKNIHARELILIMILAAVAAVSRVPFSALPSIQPTSFVIIIAAVVFGAETGFLVGAVAALVSNMFLGQGPWTPWQMFGWGMMGLTAGLLKDTWMMQRKTGRIIYGLLAGFAFGWIMNGWFLFGLSENLNWQTIVSAFAASFYFDLAHALSNAFFLIIFSASWIKVLQRYKKKYGILD